MVAPTVDVLRRLATSIHDEIGSRQGSKHSNPDLSKDIAKLMASLDDLDVYRYKEGRVLDDDEMPVPDAISVGLASLSHGSGSNPLSDFNFQFATACARRRLLPVSSLLPFLELDNPLSDERLGGTGPSLPSDKLPDLSIPPSSWPASPSAEPITTIPTSHPTSPGASTAQAAVLTPDLAPATALPAQPTSPTLPSSAAESDIPMVYESDRGESGWEDDEGSDSENPDNGSSSSQSDAEDGMEGVDEEDIAADITGNGDGWESGEELDGGLFDGGVSARDDEDDFVGADDDTDRSEGWATD